MVDGHIVNALVFVSLFCALSALPSATPSFSQIPSEDWNYVKVRENAFVFWWLYGAKTSDPSERVNKPLIMWLQGGPGGSSTGFGNFEELGPLTVELKPRNTTWLQAANVLFVDNPVGSGYSYVTDKTAFTTNVTGKRRIYMIVYFFAIIVHRYNLMVFSFVFVRIYYVAILYLGYNSVLLMGLMENGL